MKKIICQQFFLSQTQQTTFFFIYAGVNLETPCHSIFNLSCFHFSLNKIELSQKNDEKFASIMQLCSFLPSTIIKAECAKDTSIHLTCCAANSSIFRMNTVVNGSVGTVYQSALCVSTSDIIQEDGDSPLAVESTGVGNCI